MATKLISEFFDVGAVGLPIVDRPINAAPAAGVTAGSQKPVLTSSGYFSLYGKPQLAAEFIIYNEAGTVILQQSGVLTPAEGQTINSWQATGDLPLNTNYMWNHKFKSEFGEEYIESVKTSFFVPTSTVGVPEIISPTEGSTPENLNFSVQASDFVTLGVAQTHDETTLEVSTSSDFTTALQTIVKTSGDLTLVDVVVHLASTEYFIRIKYSGSSTGYSSTSITRTINTVDNSIKAPTITSPANYEVGLQQTIELESTPLQVIGEAQTQIAVEWEVYNDEELTSLFFTSGISTDSSEFTSIVINQLVAGRTYFIRKRDSGSVSGFSKWSLTSRFTAATTFADWPNWDGSSDGIKYISSTGFGNSDVSNPKVNGSVASIGFEKYISISSPSTGSNKVKVVRTSGLSVSSGEPATTSSYSKHQVVRLADDLALIAGPLSASAIANFQVCTISGNTVNVGAATDGGAALLISSKRTAVVGLSATKAVIIYTTSLNTTLGRVATISGDSVTLGAVFSVYAAPLAFSTTISSVGNKVVVAVPVSATIKVVVLDIDTTLNTGSIDDFTTITMPTTTLGSRLSTRWLDEGNILLTSDQSLNSELAILSYNDVDGIELNSTNHYHTLSGSSTSASAIEVIDAGSVLVARHDLTANTLIGHAIKIENGLAFTGQPVVLGTNFNDGFPCQPSLSLVGADKVLFTAGKVFDVEGLGHTVLNGVPA